jgi:hypothetical protein
MSELRLNEVFNIGTWLNNKGYGQKPTLKFEHIKTRRKGLSGQENKISYSQPFFNMKNIAQLEKLQYFI